MIVAVIPDRFKKTTESEVARLGKPNMDGRGNVRRPTRGIELREDTYATMRLMLGDGTPLPLVNAGAAPGYDLKLGDKTASYDYTNFLIQSVSEERAEKQQVLETFGEAYIFFFGERPRVLTIQGVLLNTFDFNWEAEWWHNYDNYLRGTKCVQNDARVYLTFDKTMVAGYILSCASSKQAQERNYVPLTFQLFVLDYIDLAKVGDSNAKQSDKAPLTSFYSDSEYRPMLVPRGGIADFSGRPNPSLIEAIATDALRVVQNTWSKVHSIVNNASGSIDSILGNPVRVPVGFLGATVFDDEPVKLAEEPAGLIGRTVIRYTTFGDNADEFVGAEPVYESSSTAYGRAMADTFSGWSAYLRNEQVMAEEAQRWADRGFIVPPAQVASVIGLAAKTDVGMQVISSARSTVRGGVQGVNVALDAASPIVAGGTEALGDLALIDDAVNRSGTDTNSFLQENLSTSSIAQLQNLKVSLSSVP